MEIDNIRIILKVAECLSINRASLFCYKTQSQVSRIVKNFEDLVQVTIFERSNKGVHITDEGKEIINYCQQIIHLYDKMCSQNIFFSESDCTGEINIYNSINIYPTISDIISSFSAEYPKISIKYTTIPSDNIITKILEDNSSIGIVTSVYASNSSFNINIPNTLNYHSITTVPIVALCSSNSSFVKKYKSLSAKAIEKLPLIQFNPYRDHPSFSSILLEQLQVKKINFRYSTDDLRILQQLLNKGAGVYIGVFPSPQLLAENIIGIPVRSHIKADFGIVLQNNTLPPINLFKDYLINWYKKIY